MAAPTRSDPSLPLPAATAAAKEAGVPVSYPAAWRGATQGAFLAVRLRRGYLVDRKDFLRWAGERHAPKPTG
jgi:hypothetical protein